MKADYLVSGHLKGGVWAAEVWAKEPQYKASVRSGTTRRATVMERSVTRQRVNLERMHTALPGASDETRLMMSCQTGPGTLPRLSVLSLSGPSLSVPPSLPIRLPLQPSPFRMMTPFSRPCSLPRTTAARPGVPCQRIHPVRPFSTDGRDQETAPKSAARPGVVCRAAKPCILGADGQNAAPPPVSQGPACAPEALFPDQRPVQVCSRSGERMTSPLPRTRVACDRIACDRAARRRT